MPIEVDEREWPLVFVNYPTEHDDAEFRAAVGKQIALIEAGRPFAMVVDQTGSTALTANQRRYLAKEMDRVAGMSRKVLLACAVVVPSSILRGAITALAWLSPPVYPYTFVSSREQAIAWVRRRLGEEARAWASGGAS